MNVKRDTVIIVLALVVIGVGFRLWDRSQDTNPPLIRHIKAIQPDWSQFKRTNGGFEAVKFRPYTGGGGMFGAFGYVTSNVQLLQLSQFMSNTHPPRPVYIAVKVVDPESFNEVYRPGLESEPDVPPDGSQPFRSKTNTESSAAGSRR